MKHKCSLGVFIAFFLLATSVLTTTISAEPAVMILDYTLDPSVLMPGDSGILTVTIYKNGSTTGETVSMSSGTSNDGAVDVQFETGSRVNVAVTSGTATTGSTVSLWLTTNI